MSEDEIAGLIVVAFVIFVFVVFFVA